MKRDKRKYANRSEYLKAAVAKRRKILRRKAITYKGGKCQLCGYDKCAEALEFHHLPGQKNFGISQKGYTRSWDKVEQELKKCVLLCSNCHREVENGVTQLSGKSRIETRLDNGES